MKKERQKDLKKKRIEERKKEGRKVERFEEQKN